MYTGLMGGTFDPIHLGHLHIAAAALGQLGLDRVVFLPDGDPPHKRPEATGEQRLRMALLACEGIPGFEVSDMELSRTGTTYTVDTLRALKARCPGERLVYLIGSDTLFYFHTWKTSREAAALCRMAVVLRPGCERAEVEARQRVLQKSHGLDSVLLDAPGPDISSRQVREIAARGGSLDGLVPPKVAEYIRDQRLYAKRAG